MKRREHEVSSNLFGSLDAAAVPLACKNGRSRCAAEVIADNTGLTLQTTSHERFAFENAGQRLSRAIFDRENCDALNFSSAMESRRRRGKLDCNALVKVLTLPPRHGWNGKYSRHRKSVELSIRAKEICVSLVSGRNSDRWRKNWIRPKPR